MRVVGARPENIVLLIHEVFEGLIADFFQGVKYEYQLPCIDCIRSVSTSVLDANYLLKVEA